MILFDKKKLKKIFYLNIIYIPLWKHQQHIFLTAINQPLTAIKVS